MNNLNKIVDELSALTVMQASELAKLLEEKWGVSASMPIATAVAAASTAVTAVEQTEFSIILTSAGDKKIEVIKVVREITSLGLKEAKELVDSAPKAVKEGITKEEVEKIKTKLEATGAKVEIK